MERLMNIFMEEIIKQKDKIENAIAEQSCCLEVDDDLLDVDLSEYRKILTEDANMFMHGYVHCLYSIHAIKNETTKANMIKLIDIIF